MTTASSQGRLQNRIALITGSSSGLGAAIAHAFANAGVTTFCVDLHPSPRNLTNPTTGKADELSSRTATQGTHEQIRQHGGEATFHKADVTKARDVELAVRACAAKYGRIDILINNAGIAFESSHVRPLRAHEVSEDDFDRTLAVNVKGIFLCCKYALKQMLDNQPQIYASKGWIVNVASILGLVTFPCTVAYSTSKGAVVQLTKQIAGDYAPDRIHVNAVCPGFLETAMTVGVQGDEGALAAVGGRQIWGQGGLGSVQDVASAVVFLASEEAKWLTGVAVPVDGGYTTR